MKNIYVLDCTLRDGGRIINCNFEDKEIHDISRRLQNARIDIVEIGFLRDWRKIDYIGNSTFFTDVAQIRPFIKKDNDTIFAAFVDFGMCDIDSLREYDGTSIDAIRFGFTKKDYDDNYDEVVRWANVIKNKGYKLFIQGVNSLNYSDSEIIDVIKFVNEINPYSFGIVDTYGAMYMDDVDRLYRIVDSKMKPDICINFHSHNNYQLSFAFAQEIIKLSSDGKRKVIIDGTLSGMGKVAGNLNTELLVEFLNRKKSYNYDLDIIFDTIDDCIHKYAVSYSWGYSVPALMAGIYKSHPNNVIYLMDKFRLNSKDIGKLLSMINPETRQRYDYDLIQHLYVEYNSTKIDDSKTIKVIKSMVTNRTVLLVMPGSSIVTYHKEIESFIYEKNPIVISVNFVTNFGNEHNRISFFGSPKRFSSNVIEPNSGLVVATSNVISQADNHINKDVYLVNYESVINRNNEDFDNTTMMLFNLLKKIGILSFYVCGFDGYSHVSSNYFNEKMFEGNRFETKFDSITNNMKIMLSNFALLLRKKSDVKFLTPSIYEEIFVDD